MPDKRPGIRKEFGTAAGTALGLLAWLLLWHIASARIGIEMILPSPGAVFRAEAKLLKTPAFWISSGYSVLRIVSGFASGVLLGTVTAFVSHFFLPVRAFFSPAVKIVRATPVSSFILIAILWMPSGSVPVFIALLMVFPIVYGNVCSGLDQTDIALIEAARLYSFSPAKKLAYLYVPTALPHLGSASVTSLGLAWKAGVAAEVLCVTKNSIGKNLYVSNLYFETAELFAWTLTVILLSVLLETLMRLATNGAKKLLGNRYTIK